MIRSEHLEGIDNIDKKELQEKIFEYINAEKIESSIIPPIEENEFNETVYIQAFVDCPVESAMSMLDDFDEEYWIEKHRKIREKVCVDVVFL